MPELNPEQEARKQIDAQLMACGWEVQDYKQYNPAASRGIALREVPLKSGTCDYLLLVDRKAVGVIEAKKVGTLLSGVAEQSGHYAANLPDLIQAAVEGPLPFLYESTGVETYFRDERDPALRVVARAAQGEAALAELDRTAVDVVVLDIEMPVMDGLTALPLILIRDPKRADRLDRAARGLGKLFWMKGFEPHFYGARELARLKPGAAPTGTPTRVFSTSSKNLCAALRPCLLAAIWKSRSGFLFATFCRLP